MSRGSPALCNIHNMLSSGTTAASWRSMTLVARRLVVLAALFVPACGTTPIPAEARAAAEAAFEYGFPLTETMRICSRYPVVNQIAFNRKLATPADTAVVAPNNDSLYGGSLATRRGDWTTLGSNLATPGTDY